MASVQNTRQVHLEMKSDPVSNLLSASTIVLLSLKDTEVMLLLKGAYTEQVLAGVAANCSIPGY